MLADLLENFGDPASAKELSETAIQLEMALREYHPGTYGPILANSYHNLAITFDGLGDYANAKESVDKAIEIWKALQEAHPGAYNAELAKS